MTTYFLKPEAQVNYGYKVVTAKSLFLERLEDDDDFMETLMEKGEFLYENDPIYICPSYYESPFGKIHTNTPNDPDTKVWFDWDGIRVWTFLKFCEKIS